MTIDTTAEHVDVVELDLDDLISVVGGGAGICATGGLGEGQAICYSPLGDYV